MLPAKLSLGERVAIAAERALENQKYVNAIDVLLGTGLLQPIHLEQWRRGQVPCLQQLIQCNPKKFSDALRLFRQWAESRGLTLGETSYSAQGPGGSRKPLQFSLTGDPDIEKAFSAMWMSPELSNKQQQNLVEKAGAPKELVVFSNLRDSTCSECQEPLPKRSFLTMENGAPFCLECADMDHLVYLPSGAAALTRRSGKYSALRAVVVEFSRSRGRYERQGLLVEPAALEQAEEECLEDEDLRARRRERDAERRSVDDANLVRRMTERILDLYPSCPPDEARAIAAHTAVRGSGRVGRTEAGRELDEAALKMAVVAAVRHRHTPYDTLLMKGVDRGDARARIYSQMEAVLEKWSAQQRRTAESS